MNPAADLLLITHGAIAAFLALMPILIPLGAWRRWRWTRHRGVRIAHLVGIAFVAAESVAGIVCPLTLLEDALRGRTTGEAGFIGRWVAAALYWDAPAWLFTLVYLVAAGLAVALWRWFPPRGRTRQPPRE